MPDAATADPFERLPWLPNAAPAPSPKKEHAWAPLLISVAMAGLIGLGAWSWLERRPAPEPSTAPVAETVPLPPPVAAPAAEPEPQGPTAAEREALRPAAAPPVERTSTPRTKKPKPRARRSGPRPSVRKKPAAAAPAYDPRAWNSGIPGRIIQLGAYRTSAIAQSEWRRVYARYPLLRPLSPRVLKTRVRGRTYYRLQLGTFSQAHSELLCQRLRALGEGCIVLGMPRRGTGR